jgi:hypothetical protein
MASRPYQDDIPSSSPDIRTVPLIAGIHGFHATQRLVVTLKCRTPVVGMWTKEGTQLQGCDRMFRRAWLKNEMPTSQVQCLHHLTMAWILYGI